MTVPPWEDAPAPPAPHVPALSAILARLTQACWADGQPHSQTLSKGLTVTAFQIEDELHLALTRQDSEPSLAEADTVARDAGWFGYTHSWKRGHSGRHGLVIARASGPPVREQATTPLFLRPAGRQAILDTFLARPRDPGRMTPTFAETFWDARHAALRAMSDGELLEELDWLWRHWGAWMGAEFARLENVMAC